MAKNTPEVPFQDRPIPTHAKEVVTALTAMPEGDSVRTQDLAAAMKTLGVKDAYRKAQKLPRLSTCNVDRDLILRHWGHVVNKTKSESTHTVKKDDVNSHKVGVLSATQNPNILKDMVKTKTYKKVERLLYGVKNPLNVFIDGDTGLGKSTAVIHVHYRQNRMVIRLNLSFATDVDDLIGGFRLIDGDTVWQDGPAVIAMQEGACLLLDELDAANPKILFELQSILEGNGVYLKKDNRMVYPTDGFHVVATGNTKGTGDMTGDFSGVNILNKAFLDRFAASITAVPPDQKEMHKMLDHQCPDNPDLVNEGLAAFYHQVLQTWIAGGIPHLVSPRRMIAFGNLCIQFGVERVDDKELKEAGDYATNKYDEEMKSAFMELLDRMIAEEKDKAIPEATATNVLDDDAPF